MILPTRRKLLALLLLAPVFRVLARETPPFDEAARQYRAGRFSDSYGRFMALANTGDVDAAHIALFMNRYGPQLYGSYWDAAPHEIERWASLIRDRAGRPQPVFVSDPYETGAGVRRRHALDGRSASAAR